MGTSLVYILKFPHLHSYHRKSHEQPFPTFMLSDNWRDPSHPFKTLIIHYSEMGRLLYLAKTLSHQSKNGGIVVLFRYQ